MDDRFSIAKLTPTWVRAGEILKGDLPGHEFHGNQWTRSQQALAELGNNHSVDYRYPQLSGANPIPTREEAQRAMELHQQLADFHGGQERGEFHIQHQDASDYHRLSADDYKKYIDALDRGAGKDELTALAHEAHTGTHDAIHESMNTDLNDENSPNDEYHGLSVEERNR